MAKRGRPSREPTREEKKKVKELVGVGASVADIAKALNRSEPNLRKFFSKELISRKKREAGRQPPFRITKVIREKVSRYIGCKMSKLEVARVIGCSVDELEEFFPEEILTGHAKARAHVIDKLHDQMEEGVAGATNRLEAITAAPDPEADAVKGPKAQGQGASYIGKKVTERAGAHAAAAAGGRFAPMAPPRVVVDNTGGQ